MAADSRARRTHQALWPATPRATRDLSGICSAGRIRGRAGCRANATASRIRLLRKGERRMIKAIDPAWQDVDCETAVRHAGPQFAPVLEKALGGDELDFADGVLLASAAGDDLLALVKTADEIRRRTVGDVLTYVVNR